VNELVCPAGTRMRTRRQGRSRRRRLCSGDQGLESAFLQRRESARTRDPLRSPGNLFLDLVAMQPGQTRRVGRTPNAKAGPSRPCSRRRCNLRAQGGGCVPSPGPGAPVSRGSGGVRHDRGLRPRAFEIAGHRAGERLDIEPSARRRACRFERTAQFPDDMAAETAIALHLGFAEPLVGRALMRELLVQRRIGTDVGRLAAVKSRFHPEEG
jgi:hypothetical protein